MDHLTTLLQPSWSPVCYPSWLQRYHSVPLQVAHDWLLLWVPYSPPWGDFRKFSHGQRHKWWISTDIRRKYTRSYHLHGKSPPWTCLSELKPAVFRLRGCTEHKGSICWPSIQGDTGHRCRDKSPQTSRSPNNTTLQSPWNIWGTLGPANWYGWGHRGRIIEVSKG